MTIQLFNGVLWSYHKQSLLIEIVDTIIATNDFKLEKMMTNIQVSIRKDVDNISATNSLLTKMFLFLKLVCR